MIFGESFLRLWRQEEEAHKRTKQTLEAKIAKLEANVEFFKSMTIMSKGVRDCIVNVDQRCTSRSCKGCITFREALL